MLVPATCAHVCSVRLWQDVSVNTTCSPPAAHHHRARRAWLRRPPALPTLRSCCCCFRWSAVIDWHGLLLLLLLILHFESPPLPAAAIDHSATAQSAQWPIDGAQTVRQRACRCRSSYRRRGDRAPPMPRRMRNPTEGAAPPRHCYRAPAPTHAAPADARPLSTSARSSSRVTASATTASASRSLSCAARAAAPISPHFPTHTAVAYNAMSS